MTPRQLLADALGVPVRRVRKHAWGDVTAVVGRVRWTVYDYPAQVTARARDGRWVASPVTRRRSVAAAVAECRRGLAAMGRGAPIINIVEDVGILFAYQTGKSSAIGWASPTHVCVYEPVGNDEIKHRREHTGDAKAALLSGLARLWPVEVVQ